MTADFMLLIVTFVSGLTLFGLAISQKRIFKAALSIGLIQLTAVTAVSMLYLNKGLIETFTSTYGLITLLMLVLVFLLRTPKAVPEEAINPEM